MTRFTFAPQEHKQTNKIPKKARSSIRREIDSGIDQPLFISTPNANQTLLSPHQTLHLQRTIGNAATTRLLAQQCQNGKATIQRHPGHDLELEEHFQQHLKEAEKAFQGDKFPEGLLHLGQLSTQVADEGLLSRYKVLLKTLKDSDIDLRKQQRNTLGQKKAGGEQTVIVELGTSEKDRNDFNKSRASVEKFFGVAPIKGFEKGIFNVAQDGTLCLWGHMDSEKIGTYSFEFIAAKIATYLSGSASSKQSLLCKEIRLIGCNNEENPTAAPPEAGDSLAKQGLTKIPVIHATKGPLSSGGSHGTDPFGDWWLQLKTENYYTLEEKAKLVDAYEARDAADAEEDKEWLKSNKQEIKETRKFLEKIFKERVKIKYEGFAVEVPHWLPTVKKYAHVVAEKEKKEGTSFPSLTNKNKETGEESWNPDAWVTYSVPQPSLEESLQKLEAEGGEPKTNTPEQEKMLNQLISEMKV